MTAVANRAASPGAAVTIEDIVAPAFGGTLPFHITAWDGSSVGSEDGPGLVIRDKAALRRLIWAPTELAIAQAYVLGEIDCEGDLHDALRAIREAAKQSEAQFGVRRAIRTARALAGWGAIGRRPETLDSQAVLRGRLHSKRRDADVIAHHYDLSNDFYSLILDESMAYSCAYWTSDAPSYTLADAQRDKLDLICHKLGLEPGRRHLDIGCGWGSFTLHAARHYGVRVVAVTLSEQQRQFVQQRAVQLGLGDRVDVRRQDYRDVPDGEFDSVTSIEMGEHVGESNYPQFTARIAALLKPGGRVLIQQMSRQTKPGGGPFIEAFIAPDMYMRPVGETVAQIEKAGLEVREVQALREHYARTADAWYETFEENWPRVVAMVGEEVARVWRLYLIGGSLAFEEGRMGVDQILAVRPGGTMPAFPEWHSR